VSQKLVDMDFGGIVALTGFIASHQDESEEEEAEEEPDDPEDAGVERRSSKEKRNSDPDARKSRARPSLACL